MRLLMTILASVFCAAASWAGPDAGDVLGRYWLPERNGQIEVVREGDRYVGRVVSYVVADQLDALNADPELRTRRFVGIDMLAAFRFDAGEALWRDGTVYDARSGKTYPARLWLEGSSREVLAVRGFIGTPFFGRTERFERVRPDEVGTVATGPPYSP